MTDNYGLFPEKISENHVINPELAAHNIASAYVNSASNSEKLFGGEDVIMSDVLSLSNQYAEAYNYAYNFITHGNKLIDEAE